MAKIEATTTTRPTILDIETLNQIAGRLDDRADQIVLISLEELRLDLKLAARCAEVLAKIRFEVGEIITRCPDHDTKLSLKNLLDDASVADVRRDSYPTWLVKRSVKAGWTITQGSR